MMNYLNALWHYLLISAPYLILGLLFAGFIHSFISLDRIKGWLGQKKKSDIFLAAFVGIPLPLCSCSVIPASVTLKKAGASNAATSSFLISTPESGIDSIVMTYGLIDLPMTIIRVVAAFCSAVVAGFFQLIFNESENDLKTEKKESVDHCCSSKKTEAGEKSFHAKLKDGFKYAFVDLINDLSFWLTVGIILGALVDLLVPENFFQTIPHWQSRFLILLVGIPLYICASATTPVAASMILKGLSPGSALLLLLVGPATNFSNIAVLQNYIGKKGILINIISIVVVALFFSYLTDFLYENIFTMNLQEISHSHSHLNFSWWEILSAIILSGLLIKGIYQEKFSHRKEHSHS